MTRRIRRLSYQWHLRRLMAEQGMFSTTDLAPHLAERGVELSSVQVYRLVVQTPERLNLHTLVVLCDILGCTPAELIEVVVEAKPVKKAASAAAVTTTKATGAKAAKGRRPSRARIVRGNE